MKELQLEELERSLTDLIKQREELQRRIKAVRKQIHNKKAYDKHFKGTSNHKAIRDGVTAQELFGKPHQCLTAEEKRLYHKIKQRERRARVKAERGRQ